MKYLILLLFVNFQTEIFSQGPVITPLNGNSALNKPIGNQSVKRAITDTISLPFLEDFTSTNVYPNMKNWRDSQVYINSHFAVSPPSIGVATFDNLDKKGRPYQTINGKTHNHSDSLTSNFINLKNYINGFNTVDYTLADSIYLSFFYQQQGLGDPSDQTDSLVLKFKNAAGFWKTVWKTSGGSVKSFKQILIGVKNQEYLIKNFQFRFINYGKTTGNMNQWHVDYIRLNSGRNMFDTIVDDVAINEIPMGPLLYYESMPYDHFKADPNYHMSNVHSLRVHNNFNNGINIKYKYDVYNTYNQNVLDFLISSSSRNIPAFSDFTENFNQFTFDTFSGKYPVLKVKYRIFPQSNDLTPDDYLSSEVNNEYTKTTYFKNYFAYDDGTAEGGFGLDYGSLPPGPGYTAVKFELSKPDTLRGVSMFFNRAVSDVLYKSFTLIVWQNISEPPAPNTNGDVVLKRIDIPTAIYTDSINGFTNIIFDTALVLTQGKFFIGWQQNSNFILNVGYDNNYKHGKIGGRNPNIFYNLNGYWEKVSSNVTGAVMMRPIVGAAIKNNNQASVYDIEVKQKVTLYPNPGSSELNFESESAIIKVSVYDLSGKLIQSNSDINITNINVDFLNDGMYLIEITNEENQKSIHKWIKQSL